ncbi:hypothetical protein [Planococcus soli]|uniref:hypothetical protein n=1 Tax=Planococcus soli TaxID=2666072 RepID=UPI00115F6187|nr:hypothetical protein [Planococcus soli]
MKFLKILGLIFLASFLFISVKGFLEGSIMVNDEAESEEIVTVNDEAEPEEIVTVNDEAESEEIATVNNETEPQKIARELVEEEMTAQIGLKEWEIEENIITSDKIVNNPADYDKPAGNKRIVWVDGNVKATADDGTTGNLGYNLELYQMEGDDSWYIGRHWGILVNLEVTEKPIVEEDEKYFSDSEEIPFPE